MNMFTTNEVVCTVDNNGVTTKYKLRVLMENAGIMLDFAEDTIDEITDPFEVFEFGQSVSFHNINTNYADELIVRKFRRHIPNYNIKPKASK